MRNMETKIKGLETGVRFPFYSGEKSTSHIRYQRTENIEVGRNVEDLYTRERRSLYVRVSRVLTTGE